jgi:hypothetical protein
MPRALDDIETTKPSRKMNSGTITSAGMTFLLKLLLVDQLHHVAVYPIDGHCARGHFHPEQGTPGARHSLIDIEFVGIWG